MIIFMDTLRHDALTMIDYQQSGMTNTGMFIINGALDGSIFLFVFSLAFGAGYGLLSSLLGAQDAPLRTQPATKYN